MSTQLPLFPDQVEITQPDGQWVIVFDDDETYARARDCKVLFVPPTLDVEAYVKGNVRNLGYPVSVLTDPTYVEMYGDMLIPTTEFDNTVDDLD
jgi:hypothetical protein